MKLRTIAAAIAIAAFGVASLGAEEAEARHGRKAAIIAGAAILGLGLAAAASRPRHYDDGYGYYDDYDGRDHYSRYDYGPPPRGYYREPRRRYYAPRRYYDDARGPYDYPESYAKYKNRQRTFYD